MRQLGNNVHTARLPEGFKVPTGIFEADAFFGGGLPLGDYVGLVHHRAHHHAKAEMALLLARIASACAPVACFVTPDKEDAKGFLEQASTRDGLPPTLDISGRVALHTRDSLSHREWAGELEAQADRAFPIDLVQGEEVCIGDIEDAAKRCEVIVIDDFSRLVEAGPLACLKDGTWPDEGIHDKLKQICEHTGALLIVGAPAYRALGNAEESISCAQPFLDVFDKAFVVDFPLTIEELVDYGDASTVHARVRCTDTATRECSNWFELEYETSSGFHTYSLKGMLGLLHGDQYAIYGPEPFAAAIALAEEDSRGEAKEEPKEEPKDGTGSGSALEGAGEGGPAWFSQEMERRRLEISNRPFKDHARREKLMLDDDALLEGLLRHESKLVLHQPPCSCSLETMLFLLKHEVPELLYVEGIHSMCPLRGFLWLLEVDYRMSTGEALEALDAIEQVTAPVIEQAKALALDDRVTFLYEWLCENVVHTGGEVQGLTEMDAPLLLHRGSASAIVKAWHYLCERARVWSTPMVGTKGGKLHVWSIVATEPGVQEYCSPATQVLLHYDIAESVRLSNEGNRPRRVLFGLEREDMLHRGYEMPFDLVNDYAPDLKEQCKDAKRAD